MKLYPQECIRLRICFSMKLVESDLQGLEPPVHCRVTAGAQGAILCRLSGANDMRVFATL